MQSTERRRLLPTGARLSKVPPATSSLNLLVLTTKVYRILFFFRPFGVSMTNITRGHRVSTKIKESTEVAHFGANFALTKVHENL